MLCLTNMMAQHPVTAGFGVVLQVDDKNNYQASILMLN